MMNKKTLHPLNEISKTPIDISKSEAISENKKKKILKSSFVEQELLNASMIQKELMMTIRELNTQIHTLNTTLNLIREHEFVEFHKSKWRIIIYQLALGILFAIGTVGGLALISWSTYTFFKDNEILRQIVDKQLNSRNFNLTEIRERAAKDAGKPVQVQENSISNTDTEVLPKTETQTNQILSAPMSTASGEVILIPKS